MRFQKGSICLRSGSFYVRAYQNGKQKNFFLVRKDERHHSATCKPVKLLASEVMKTINADGSKPEVLTTCSEFWTGTYLPWCEANLRHSSVYSYKQIWRQHVEEEIGQARLNDYATHQASVFLTKLSKSLGRRTLSHVRSLLSSIFSHALNLGLIPSNPIAGCKVLGKVKAPKPSPHYTKEEVDAVISALKGMADCQLVFALGFYQAMRPSEIAALQWSDVGPDSLHIRRGIVRGHLDETKTEGSSAEIPLIEPTRELLAKWKSETAPRVFVLEAQNGNPLDLHNMVSRRIKPRLKQKKVQYKPLYALRRGSATHLTHLLGNPIASAQLLRHKNYQVTLTNYVQKDRTALVKGMKKFEKS